MSIDQSLGEIIKAAVGEVIQPSIEKAFNDLISEISKRSDLATPYYNLNGAADYLNVTRQSLTTYMKNGVVKFYRLNGSPRFKKEDLDSAMIPVEIKIYR
jgi:hypothetical protein